MNRSNPDRGTMLEIGLVVLAVAIVGGFLVTVVCGQAGEIQRRWGRSQPPPERGTVPPGRHQNISSTAAR
ncbi:MAG: hypothetical protein M0Z94_12410 [Dehalococcoidales bacterium]|nr:hypothetical protein [Dehalococcoidales bacterium]